MIYIEIETNLFIVIAVCIIAFLPSLVFAVAYLISLIEYIKNKKKLENTFSTERKGAKKELKL